MLVAKTNSNTLKILISRALIDSDIKFDLVNDFLNKYNKMTEAIKNPDCRWICLVLQKDVNLRKKFTTNKIRKIFIVLNAQDLQATRTILK